MNAKQMSLLVLLSALWGSAYLFIRIAAPELGPILLVTVRVFVTFVLLALYGMATKQLPSLRTHWKQYLVMGAINNALPYFLISTAELHLTSSLAAIINATMPLFTLIVSIIWLKEGLSIKRAGALLIGLIGVGALVGLGPIPVTPALLWATAASLAGAFSYGLATVYTKAKIQGASPLGIAMYSQLFATLWMLPAVPFTLPSAWPSLTATMSVLLLAVLCTALTFPLYFSLIYQVGPTRAATVSFLAPAFGLLWGAVFLQETIAVGSIVGLVLILWSVYIVTRSSPDKKAVAAGAD